MVSIWPSLPETLAQHLPEGVALQCYHISTPPTRCLDIYSPAPGQPPEKTYSESHSLTVSTSLGEDGNEDQIAIFAIELVLYTTTRLSTLFVSKADSTGYAHLLRFPKSAGSVLQLITSTFISWLVRSRTRLRQRLVLSLFARAQGQYLFPGSVENEKKHVLDDRGLVKWWCKTLDPVIREYPLEGPRKKFTLTDDQTQSKAYLIVPGLDSYETTAFFPARARQDPPDHKRWTNGHPLRQILLSPAAPPRCLIPHFPDDPKSRFLDELDEEISDVPSSQQAKLESPSKRGPGLWKSVKTLEQFWEMMAYRQECSSGRLVGFIWVVFTPVDAVDIFDAPSRARSSSPTLLKRKAPSSLTTIPSPPTKKPSRTHPLKGPIHARAPRVKTTSTTASNNKAPRPERTPWYYWPQGTRGTLVLAQKQYDRVHEILLRLDFASVEVATASTGKWIREAGVIAGVGAMDWGTRLVGLKRLERAEKRDQGVETVNLLVAKKKTKNENTTMERNANNYIKNQATPSLAVGTTPNILGNSLVRKKPKPESTDNMTPLEQAPVNILGGILVRKKDKVELDTRKSSQTITSENHTPVNALGAMLVRKKEKVEAQ